MEEMLTRVMFDLSAFSDFVSHNESSATLLQSRNRKRIRAYASFAFLEELAPLRATNPALFHSIRKHYVQATFPRLILPGNELVLSEVREGRPITREEALLSETDYMQVINHLAEEDVRDLIVNEVRRRKHNYESQMNDAHCSMMKDPLLRDESEIRHAFKDWFANAEGFLQSRGEKIFGRRDIRYARLPHVRMFLFCFFARLYQATVDRRKHQEGDGYDRAYLVESVTIGHLVTNDRNLRSTAKQIKNSGIAVYSLDEFIALATPSVNDETRAIQYSQSQIGEAVEQ